jgi:hypothetical protein
MVASSKNSKWWMNSRWRRQCFYFSIDIFKNDLLLIFLNDKFENVENTRLRPADGKT